MKNKKHTSTAYQIYDLSNPHFQKAEIQTKENKIIKGQFVKFKVNENNSGYKIYPSEKFCFLPIESEKDFWNAYTMNGGIFEELPAYIMEFGMTDIKKICLEPTSIV